MKQASNHPPTRGPPIEPIFAMPEWPNRLRLLKPAWIMKSADAVQTEVPAYKEEATDSHQYQVIVGVIVTCSKHYERCATQDRHQ